MATHAEIPADFNADDIAYISHVLDLVLNSNIFYALLSGMHILLTPEDIYVSP